MKFMVSLFAAQLLMYFIFDIVLQVARLFQATKFLKEPQLMGSPGPRGWPGGSPGPRGWLEG